MVAIVASKPRVFTDGAYLRSRVVLSTLSKKPVRFTHIREDDSKAPGLSLSEISFIRLIDKITTGSTIEINETGTSLLYKPGILVGGQRLMHSCHPSRSLTYYIEPLLMLAPFSKHPIDIILHGPTHAPSDLCIDSAACVTIPLLRRLTHDTPTSPQLEVRSRAMASENLNSNGKGGCARLKCGVVRTKLRPIHLVDTGVVKRIRGLAFANKVSPSFMSRMIDTTRGALNSFTPDVYVHTDHNNARDCGVGYGLQLVAETTEGCLLGADWSSSQKGMTPETVADFSCRMLLEEIAASGCIDSNNTSMALLYCALADSSLSVIRIGRLSEATIQFMRDLQGFFGVTFHLKVEDKSRSEGVEMGEGEERYSEMSGTMVSCIGIGYTNSSRHRF